jgi:type IV pilus assembly protein PilZ
VWHASLFEPGRPQGEHLAEKRTHPRVIAIIDVTCKHADGATFAAVAKDVSLGGMFLECDDSPPFGTQLTLECRLPGARQDSALPAVVRWTNAMGFGVQFGLLGARETHSLTELMRRHR